MARFLKLMASLLLLLQIQQSTSAASVVNLGTQDWLNSARSGRADMLIIGDSIVNHGSAGWTGGIAFAFADTLGLAGTEMMGLATPAIYPGRGGARALLDSAWKQPTASLPASLQPYALGEEILLAGATQPGTYLAGLGIDDDLIDRTPAFDWQLWVAGTAATDGTVQGLRAARVTEPWSRTVLETTAITAVPASAAVPQLVELSFAPAPGEARQYHEFSFQNTTDTAVFYHRLVDPAATGVTVTGWGYSGFPTRDFVLDLYDNGRLNAAGRAAYLAALVHGNSGKLNIVIAEGVNDSAESDPSLTEGVTPGSSSEAFIDNVKTLIALNRSDWALAGFDAADLSFTLLSPYQVDPDRIGETRWNRLAGYRDALRALAMTDPQYSFIDTWELGPTAEEAVAEMYIHDGLHPSGEGAKLYGDLFRRELLTLPPVEPVFPSSNHDYEDHSGEDHSGEDWSGVSLIGAHLPNTDFNHADLSAANLRKADLGGANLSFTNFQDANLEGALVTTSRLRFADFSGANLDGAVLGDGSRLDGFTYEGTLDLVGGTTSIESLGFAGLGTLTTISDATLVVENGIVLGDADNLSGFGVIEAKVSATFGSTILVDGGDLTLGDIAEMDGFFSDGQLIVGGNTVTIQDANEAVLGSLSTLGEADVPATPGTMAAPNGFLLEAGKNVVGYGTIDGDFINQGHVEGVGPDPGDGITFTADVSGSGSYAGNITFLGGLSPGSSPGEVTIDGNTTLGIAAMVVMELGGLRPGTEHDQLIVSGTFSADGTLRLLLINGFVPKAGDTFSLFGFDGVDGAFDHIDLPPLGGGLSFDTTTLLTTGSLHVVPEPHGALVVGLSAMASFGLRRRRNRIIAGDLWRSCRHNWKL